MSTPKRPESPPEGGTSTLVTGPASDEEPQSEAPKTVEVAADDSENGGATAFLRAPPLRRPAAPKPAAEQSPASTVAMRAEPAGGGDDSPGGTAFVRLDGQGGQQRRKEPLAPPKGLHVSLPEDQPAPPPPPQPLIAPPTPDQKNALPGARRREQALE